MGKTSLAATLMLSVAMILPAISSASADDTLTKLGEFKQSGWHGDWPTDPANRAEGRPVKKNLTKIKLPPGFHIGLYALVPDARHMAVGPQGFAVFVGTRKTKVYVVTDRDRNFVADEVKEFAPSLAKKIPNGPCFSKDGFLFIVEQNRVLMYPAAEFFYESPDVVAVPIVPQGQLIPKEEESYNHTARECRIGPDNKLYIQHRPALQRAAASKWALYKTLGMGGIIRMDRDGKNREIYANGMRNPEGMDFNPKDGDAVEQ